MTGIVDFDSDTFRYWGTGDEPLEMTTYHDAAKVTAEVALDESTSGFVKGKYILSLFLPLFSSPFRFPC